MPPTNELTRIEPAHLDRLEHQGVFTTGLLLEVSETPVYKQYAGIQELKNSRTQAKPICRYNGSKSELAAGAVALASSRKSRETVFTHEELPAIASRNDRDHG